MSTIFGICEMPTGHASMHAAQVVQAHNESMDSAGVAEMIGSLKSFRECESRCKSKIMSRGESDLPTALAGQAEVQRPHSVQASKSRRSFQVKPAREFTPRAASGLSKLSVLRAAPRGVSGAA